MAAIAPVVLLVVVVAATAAAAAAAAAGVHLEAADGFEKAEVRSEEGRGTAVVATELPVVLVVLAVVLCISRINNNPEEVLLAAAVRTPRTARL